MNTVTLTCPSVAVTGASGFIGSMVSSELSQSGLCVRNGYRNEVAARHNSFKIDLGRKLVAHGFLDGAQVLVHAAGPAHTSLPEERRFRIETIDGGRWLFEKAVAAGVKRIVLVSSCKAGYEFGEGVSESDIDRPGDIYGKVKLELEQMLVALAEMARVEWVIFRPALVYGIGVKGNLSAWFRRARNPLLPRFPSAGYRSMVSVADLATAIGLGCTHPNAANKRFYVSDGVSYSISEIDSAIRRGGGLRYSPIQLPWVWRLAARVGDIAAGAGMDIGFDGARLAKLTKTATCSATLLRAQLSWHPTTTFYEQLPSMLAVQSSVAKSRSAPQTQQF